MQIHYEPDLSEVTELKKAEQNVAYIRFLEQQHIFDKPIKTQDLNHNVHGRGIKNRLILPLY